MSSSLPRKSYARIPVNIKLPNLIEVQLDSFERLKREGLGDEELRELESAIMERPAAPVIRGTGGLRKIRLGTGGRGKSSGIRACFTYFANTGTVYLIAMFAKNEKSNLTDVDANAIAKLPHGRTLADHRNAAGLKRDRCRQWRNRLRKKPPPLAGLS